MLYKIITLENKTDSMIAVRIPISILIFFGGNTIDDKVTAVVSVKTAYNIQ